MGTSIVVPSASDIVDLLVSSLSVNAKKGGKAPIDENEIDKLEKKLQNSIALLRGLRNRLQPIHRLPSEILTSIFQHCRTTSFSFLPDDVSPRPRREPCENCQWLPLVRVCRHWRGVIACSPSLWSVIDNQCTGITTKACLSRSRTAPLDVFLGMASRKFSSEDLALILPEVSRFRQLHIDTSRWNGHPDSLLQALSVVQSGAPSLTSLTFLHAKPIEVTANGAPPSGALPTIFGGNLPALKQLTLEAFSSWPSQYFHNLTHLCLFNQVQLPRSSTSAFLDFVESSPGLEELVLVDAGPTRMAFDDFPQVSPNRCPVELSHLKELVIGEWPAAMTIRRFLTYLSLPTTTNIHVYGGYKAASLAPIVIGAGAGIGPGFPTAMSTITENSENNLYHGITFLPLDFPPTQTVTKLSLNRVTHASAPHGILPHYTVRTSELYVVDEYTNMDIRSMTSVPGLQQITTLVVRDATESKATPQGGWGPNAHCETITIETWRIVFEVMKSLKTLQIMQHEHSNVLPTRKLLEALFPHTAHAKREVTRVPSPTLETIILQGLYPAFPAFLIALAKARHEQNCPLRSVGIHFDNDIISVEKAHDPSNHDRSNAYDSWGYATEQDASVTLPHPDLDLEVSNPEVSGEDIETIEAKRENANTAGKAYLDALDGEWKRMRKYVGTLVINPFWRRIVAGPTYWDPESTILVHPLWWPSRAYRWIHPNLPMQSARDDADHW